ncbi:hypothetical protein [Nonomuraea wenchangensis]|uniref:hypothetical protein n=1 Tax=Nonomuraea wenchangensis TaxID=568860 RepID=UPI00331B30FC
MIDQARARTLARKYRCKTPFIVRLAAFSAAIAAGADRWDTLRQLGPASHSSYHRYLRWEAQLRGELADLYDDTPSDEGDKQ